METEHNFGGHFFLPIALEVVGSVVPFDGTEEMLDHFLVLLQQIGIAADGEPHPRVRHLLSEAVVGNSFWRRLLQGDIRYAVHVSKDYVGIVADADLLSLLDSVQRLGQMTVPSSCRMKRLI